MPSGTSQEAHDEAAAALDGITTFVIRHMAVQQEVSFTAASTLSTLQRFGPRRITELAVHQGVSQPSMTSMTARLERQGFIQRQQEPADGRIVLVAITEAGERMLARRRAGRRAFLATMIEKLDADDQLALAGAAEALRALTDPDVVPEALVAAKAALTAEHTED
ncbi:MAG: MarR family winged helix-turn-helix transcriptional regulator [Sciscionella sp.]